MAFFDSTVAALAAGNTVLFAYLVHFDFQTGDSYVWSGFGDVVIDGHTWSGMGELGSVGETQFGINDAADFDTYTLSGVTPELVTLARNSAPVRGRDVTKYGQFFGTDLQPYDAPFVLKQSIMDRLTYAGMGPNDRRITLTAETIWANRNAAAFAYFSDKDQQIRFPGDRGLERLSTMTATKRVRWPVF